MFFPPATKSATDFRQRFFHVSADPLGEELGSNILRVFEAWKQTGVCTIGESRVYLTEEQVAIAAEGHTALNFWFSQKHSHPEVPKSFTDEAGWLALRQALHSNKYWLSAAELQCIAACWSCHVHVHIDDGSVDSIAFSPLLDPDSAPAFQTDAYVMLQVAMGLNVDMFSA